MRAKLQRLREANGYTQQAFSSTVGTSCSHYSQIETGEKHTAAITPYGGWGGGSKRAAAHTVAPGQALGVPPEGRRKPRRP